MPDCRTTGFRKEVSMKSFTKLAPDEVLAIAIGVEGTNAARYAIWADRIRPYNEDVSELFDELAEEEKLYQKKLTDMFTERYGKKKVLVDPDRISKVVKDSNLDLEHFFVLDEKMEKGILLEAMKAEFETFVFFKQALLSTKDPRLMELYNKLADFEKQHVDELNSSIEEDEAKQEDQGLLPEEREHDQDV